MKIGNEQIINGALSGLLFLAVFHTLSLLIDGQFLFSSVFAISALLIIRCLQLKARGEKASSNHQLTIITGLLWIGVTYLASNKPSLNSGPDFAWFFPLVIASHVLLGLRKGSILALISIAITLCLRLPSESIMLQLHQALPLLIFVVLLSLLLGYQKQLQLELRQAATSDALTGCISPSHFKLDVEKAAELQQRYQTHVTCLILKIDAQFKRYDSRETWLKEVAQVCQSRVRQTDVVCRYSDSRFLVLLPSTDTSNAQKLSTDLIHACDAYEFSIPHSEVLSRPKFACELSSYNSEESWESWFSRFTS